MLNQQLSSLLMGCAKLLIFRYRLSWFFAFVADIVKKNRRHTLRFGICPRCAFFVERCGGGLSPCCHGAKLGTPHPWQLESMSSTPDQLTTKSNGNRSRQDDRDTLPTSGDTIRSNRHPDQLTTKSNGNRSRQDDRDTLPTSGDTIRINRHPDKMRNQPTPRRATRKATNRPA